MRLLAICLVVICLGTARPAAAQWSTPTGIVITPAADPPAAVDIGRPQRITWLDFSSGLLGAIIGFIIATAICDDEPERRCPAATPVFGGAIGAAIGVAVGRSGGG